MTFKNSILPLLLIITFFVTNLTNCTFENSKSEKDPNWRANDKNRNDVYYAAKPDGISREAEQLFRKAEWYKRRNNYHEAYQIYYDIIRNHPSEIEKVDAYTSLGVTKIMEGDYIGAYNPLKKAIEISPNDVRALVALSELENKEKNDDHAKYYLEKALQIEPNNSGALWGMGHVYKNTKEYELSIIYFEKFIKAAPKSNNVIRAKKIISSMKLKSNH